MSKKVLSHFLGLIVTLEYIFSDMGFVFVVVSLVCFSFFFFVLREVYSTSPFDLRTA